MNIESHAKSINIKKEALEAEKRIREYIRETPVEYSPYLSQSGNCEVYLKLENLQLSGSFKLRGTISVASFVKAIERFKNKNVVLIISGAKISLDQLKEVLF